MPTTPSCASVAILAVIVPLLTRVFHPLGSASVQLSKLSSKIRFGSSGVAAVTVTSHVSVTEPAATVIVTVPALTPVTVPSVLTVAMLSSLLLQTTSVVASAGVSVADSITVFPASTVAVSLMLIEVASIFI